MPRRQYLVMVETNGNQRFIFDAPRLRDAVGASSLLTRLDSWVRDAVPALPGKYARSAVGTTPGWVSVASGKVLLTVAAEEDARRVISEVTRRALTDAPGMDVSGVFTEIPGPGVTQGDLERIHQLASRRAVDRPPARARFAQVPFLERAKDSALPAVPFWEAPGGAEDDREEALSLPARVKRRSAYSRRRELLTAAMEESALLEAHDDRLVRDPTMLEEALRRAFLEADAKGGSDADDEAEPGARGSSEDREVFTRIEGLAALSRVAVIHIDGNGVGAVMRDLEGAMARVPPEALHEAGAADGRPGGRDLRRFILGVNERLERAVVGSFARAWARVAELSGDIGPIPVVPVILGGDDVTVITGGEHALPFAAEYLREYEERTSRDPVLRHLGAPAGGDGGTGPMTAAAGVAVVRRNYPFHTARALAEELVRRGKRKGKAVRPVCSTLDFHVLLDTTVMDPIDTLSAYADYTARPYLFGANADRGAEGTGDTTWDAVCARVRNFTAIPGGDGAPFPRTRAARIVRLLAEGKRCRTGDGHGVAAPPAAPRTAGVSADSEWEMAKEGIVSSAPLEDLLGGPEALFDLSQLADLLPGAYLDPPPASSATPDPPAAPGNATAKEHR